MESQSELLLQLVLHAVAPHTYGEQSCCTIAGHCLPLPPGQLAATVSTPFVHEADRQVVEAEATASAGQLVLEPLQDSATSQASEAGRHTPVVSEQVPVAQL